MSKKRIRRQNQQISAAAAVRQTHSGEKEQQFHSLSAPPLRINSSSIQRSEQKNKSENKSVEQLWEEFDQARMGMYSDYALGNPDPTQLALLLVKKMNPAQAQKYGLELYLWLEYKHADAAKEALAKFESSWTQGESGPGSVEFDFADRRKPDFLLTYAEQAYAEDQLTNCTNLLRSALAIAQLQYRKLQTDAKKAKGSIQKEDIAGDIDEVKQMICRIYGFYDYKALYESKLDHSDKLPYLTRESDKVQELLTVHEAIGSCSLEDNLEPEPVQKPQQTPPTHTPKPKSPEQKSQEPKDPQQKGSTEVKTPEYKGAAPTVKKDDQGINLKVVIALPSKKILGSRKLGKYLDLDSVNLGGEIEIEITLFGNKDADDQTTMAEISIDGQKKLVGIKKEFEQQLLERAKTNGSSFNIKAKEGLSFDSETGEVGIGLEADFWSGGSYSLTFKLIEVDKGTVNVGVLSAKLAASPLGIMKLFGMDLNKHVDAKARSVFPSLKGVKVTPKVFLEAKLSPNYTAIMEELAKRGVKWAASAAGEGALTSGFAAITAAELATLGVGAAGAALTVAALALSADDNQRRKSTIASAKRSCRDFRLGFLSALGYPTAAVSKTDLYFKDGQRAGATWFAQSVNNMIAKEGTAENDLAKEGTSVEDIRKIVQIKLTDTYDQASMYNTIGMYTGVAEHQIKELHIKAWKEGLGWRRDAISYEYDERVIRMHLFPKFDAHGKPIRY